MGSLIGMRVSLKEGQPKEFIGALYEEIFDLHPEDAEVDVVVRINHLDDDTGFTVVDYRVFRVGEEYFGDVSDEADRRERLMEMDAWGRNENQSFYVFMHKHLEGNLWPSPKDTLVNQVLSSIDYARSEWGEDVDETPRRYNMMAILNREESIPLSPSDQPTPIGNADIDRTTETRMWTAVTKKYDKSDPDFVEADAIHTKVLAASEAGWAANDRDDQKAIADASRDLKHLMIDLQPILERLDRKYRPAAAGQDQRLADLLGIDIKLAANMLNAMPASLRESLASLPAVEIEEIHEDPFSAGLIDEIRGLIGEIPESFFDRFQDETIETREPDDLQEDEPEVPPEIITIERPDVPDVFQWVD